MTELQVKLAINTIATWMTVLPQDIVDMLVKFPDSACAVDCWHVIKQANDYLHTRALEYRGTSQEAGWGWVMGYVMRPASRKCMEFYFG